MESNDLRARSDDGHDSGSSGAKGVDGCVMSTENARALVVMSAQG